MNKFYTSRGDQGKTDQIGKDRLSKSHIRIQTVGALDEASAALGFARAQISDPAINELIKTIQMDLYRMMSIVVQKEPDLEKIPDLEPGRVAWLEEKIDHYGSLTDSPREFILPGENLPSGAIGMARTIVRRAERDLVSLAEAGMLFSETALSYLNRLSSLCFVLELFCAQNPPSRTENPS
ncbi:MAG TPA: cob(I)yrinic acid a,c-diamide adenosyltransferase [Chloroflexi bacterium]|nr:cob(I)yrinic acid a,c-diamide adenosyltransferase [Chloroflexota bacterium]